MTSIISADSATEVIRKVFPKEQLDLKEFFGVLLLTQSNCLLGASIVGIGTCTGVLVNCKEIFQLALLVNASAIIITHNHPSGALKVSESDHKLTQKIKETGELMDINLLDHIIITSESYCSLAEQGHL